jgi:hypothetical protein
MSAIASTSGRLHSEFIRLFFLQDHRETDRFFAASGVHLPEQNCGLFRFRRAAFSVTLKTKIWKDPPQDCNFTYQFACWWDTYHFKNTYSPITLVNISSINLVFIFRCSSSPNNPVYTRRVDFSSLVFSLSSHRHSNIGLLLTSRFLDS